MDLTHDEIAQAIGASRETVTRSLASFRKKQLASLTRSMLLVKNRTELEKIAGIAAASDESTPARVPGALGRSRIEQHGAVQSGVVHIYKEGQR